MANKFQNPKPLAELSKLAPREVIPNQMDLPAGNNNFTGIATAFVNSNGKSGLHAVHTKDGVKEADAVANLHYVNSNSELDHPQKIARIAYLMNLWYNLGARPAGASSASGQEQSEQAGKVVNFQEEAKKQMGGGGGVDFQSEFNKGN